MGHDGWEKSVFVCQKDNQESISSNYTHKAHTRHLNKLWNMCKNRRNCYTVNQYRSYIRPWLEFSFLFLGYLFALDWKRLGKWWWIRRRQDCWCDCGLETDTRKSWALFGKSWSVSVQCLLFLVLWWLSLDVRSSVITHKYLRPIECLLLLYSKDF